MAITKTYTRDVPVAGSFEKVQALTGDSTGTLVAPYGFTTIVVTTGEGTAANLTYQLPAPGAAGVRKLIAADLNSTKQVVLTPVSTAQTFFGSTRNLFTWSTGSTAPPAHVELVATSATEWAVLNVSSTSIVLT